MTLTRLAAAACLLLAACGTPGKDPGTIRYAESGTQIALSNVVDGQVGTALITVGSSSGTEGSYVGADGQTGTFYPGCWGCGGDVEIEREKYDALWPLAPGKSVEFMRTGPDGSQAKVTIRVVGNEKIETGAGFFDTVLLESRMESTSGAPWTAVLRTWWSDKLGWAIKSEGEDSRGTTLSSEVVRFVPPS